MFQKWPATKDYLQLKDTYNLSKVKILKEKLNSKSFKVGGPGFCVGPEGIEPSSRLYKNRVLTVIRRACENYNKIEIKIATLIARNDEKGDYSFALETTDASTCTTSLPNLRRDNSLIA